MPASDVGLLVLAKSIVLTAFVLTNGFSYAVFRYASLFRGENRKDKIKGIVLTAYRYVVPIYIIVFIAVSLLAGYIAVNIFHNPELALLIRMLAVVVFFTSVIGLNNALLRSKYLVQYRYIFDVTVQLLTLFFVFILFVFDLRNFLIMFTVSWAVAAFFVMAGSFRIVKREFAFAFDHTIKMVEHKRKLFLYAFVSQVTSLLDRFRLEINVFIMGFFLATSDIALYNVAFQMGMVAAILLEGLNNIFPAVAGVLYGQDKISEIKRIHGKSALILFSISVLIFIFFLIFGKLILSIFGEYYRKAFVPLLIISFSFMVESGVGSAGRILNMMGKPHYNTVNTFTALVFTVGLCYALIPVYGVIGAALSFAVSNIIKRLMMLSEVLWVYRAKEKFQKI